MTRERLVYRSRRSSRKQRTWRSYDDRQLPPLRSLGPATSLSPGPAVAERYADGDPIARAIITAWEPSIVYASLIREVHP